MTRPDWPHWGERLAARLYPRRCPFCGAVLAGDAVQGAFCPACAAEEARLAHEPPRLPETEHDFYAVSTALAAYYYDGAVRGAILLCKRGGHPWYARELADRMAVRIWGAEPAPRAGRRPQLVTPAGLVRYHCIVPVPPRQPYPGMPGLPLLLARRLSAVLGAPVETPLCTTRPLQPQKQLTRAERRQNAAGAYACRPHTDLSGKHVLLVDDIITTGATASACAMALLQAGAAEVTVSAIAATEDLPREKRPPAPRKSKNQSKNRADRSPTEDRT